MRHCAHGRSRMAPRPVLRISLNASLDAVSEGLSIDTRRHMPAERNADMPLFRHHDMAKYHIGRPVYESRRIKLNSSKRSTIFSYTRLEGNKVTFFKLYIRLGASSVSSLNTLPTGTEGNLNECPGILGHSPRIYFSGKAEANVLHKVVGQSRPHLVVDEYRTGEEPTAKHSGLQKVPRGYESASSTTTACSSSAGAPPTRPA